MTYIEGPFYFQNMSNWTQQLWMFILGTNENFEVFDTPWLTWI